MFLSVGIEVDKLIISNRRVNFNKTMVGMAFMWWTYRPGT
jgi:hypothetical protein